MGLGGIVEDRHCGCHAPETETFVEGFLARHRVQDDLPVPRRKANKARNDLPSEPASPTALTISSAPGKCDRARSATVLSPTLTWKIPPVPGTSLASIPRRPRSSSAAAFARFS